MLETVLPYVQLIVAVLLVVSVLLQSRGAGVGGLFGGSDDVYRAKRGMEKFLFYLTIVLGFLFVGGALVNVIIASNA